MHTVYRAAMQLAGEQYGVECELEVVGRLAKGLLIGSYYEMVVTVVGIQLKSHVGIRDVRLCATSATRLSTTHLRAHQLQCPLQNCGRLVQRRTLHSLVDLIRTASCPRPANYITWYQALAVLISAVAAGEDQRQGKIECGTSHRCQVQLGNTVLRPCSLEL